MSFRLGMQTLVWQFNLKFKYWLDWILLTLFHRWNNLRVSDLGLMAMSVCLVKVAGSKKGASSGLYCLSSLARHLRTTSLLTFGGILITPTLWPRNRVCKVKTLWEGHKIWKNLPPVLTKHLFLHSSVKTSGRFFQIFLAFSEKLNFTSRHANLKWP